MIAHEGFLDDIRANPDDDAPRLIYADWLEEQGQAERAQFIRLQCELARYPEGHPTQRKLVVRERKYVPLMRTWAREALDPSGSDISLECRSGHSSPGRGKAGLETRVVLFRRGFIDEVILLARIFPTEAENLVRIPTLQAVGLCDIAGNQWLIETIAKVPALARFRRVRVEECTFQLDILEFDRLMPLSEGYTPAQGMTSQGLSRFLQSPYLETLESLELPRSHLHNDACVTLARATKLRSLRVLDLSQNPLGPDGLAFLAHGRHLANLRSLSLAWINVGPRGVPALAALPCWSTLRNLDLSGTSLLAAGIQQLLADVPLDNLTSLKLQRLNIQVRAIHTLASSPRLRNLEVLDLNRNKIGDRGANALASSPHLANLRVLRLRRNSITVDGVRALARSPHLQKLEVIDLKSNPIREPERKALRAEFGKDFGFF